MTEACTETPRTAHPPPPIVWREREAGEPPLGPAACVERMRAAHAFRVAVQAELDALCVDPKRMPCASCTLSDSCNRILSSLLIRTLNAATEQVREEKLLLARIRHDARYARTLGAHQFAHDQLINDLSAHVMDWGRLAPGDVVAATSALLKYWNEAHFAMHDELLMSAVRGNAT